MEISGLQERKLAKLKGREAGSVAVSHCLATGFGLGYLPLAPGTWASLVTATIWFGVYTLAPPMGAWIANILVVFFLFPLAWISSGQVAKFFGDDDPNFIVIDEIIGQSIPFLFVSEGIYWFLGGFALFRVFDILKPPPVGHCEKFPGGLGVILDDCMAGLYAGLVLLIFHAL
jgi:phosphatidylglycerophosphatase A